MYTAMLLPGVTRFKPNVSVALPHVGRRLFHLTPVQRDGHCPILRCFAALTGSLITRAENHSSFVRACVCKMAAPRNVKWQLRPWCFADSLIFAICYNYRSIWQIVESSIKVLPLNNYCIIVPRATVVTWCDHVIIPLIDFSPCYFPSLSTTTHVYAQVFGLYSSVSL